ALPACPVPLHCCFSRIVLTLRGCAPAWPASALSSARASDVRRWCQRAAAAVGPAGASGGEGRAGAAHGAHQRRRQDHLRPLQLIRLRHVSSSAYTPPACILCFCFRTHGTQDLLSSAVRARRL
uniref:Uncharacterized protein n=1 Tax=Aegilops tauschii subsp. strangulata TaxID=200361 RepID=A0A453FWP2_AEGTS